MEWTITIVISIIGIGLAFARSSWIVDYAVFVFVLNRGLRRLVDFYVNESFNPLSPISLTPLIVSGAMAVPLVLGFKRLPGSAKRIFLCLAGAMGYAFAIGFLNQGFGAVYAFGEVLAPVAMAGYVVSFNAPVSLRDRWIRSFSWAAILASAYGWYQYLTIPPWDAFWLREVGMIGYMGIPEPTKMSVFSTMGERGPLASYLGFALVPMIVSPRWRTFLGWPAVVLVFSTIVLTVSRGGVLIALIGTLIFLLVNRGAKFGQIALATVVVGLAVWFGIGLMPGSERLIERFETLGNMGEDGSFQGRMAIMAGGTGAVLENPLGGGLGASGLGTRVNTGGTGTTTSFGDAGYFQIFLVYGIIGSGLLLGALILAWKRLGIYYRVATLRNEHVLLIRALMIAMIPACAAGDMLTGFSIFWLALGCGLAVPRSAVAKTIAILEAAGMGGKRLDGELAAEKHPSGR